ncbi:hypothetical protein L3Y34_004375 [Caenorhabditis briggsae]|uniref:Uncharacterized protein n=1 Tax=Caenorhabditis briggsae TaxID=6238 RepID=A0AAE9D5Q2_CAEBR|nr:hypothetical protein L3Y34_004375 [Caenorhabditis briggsae]
MFVVFLSLLHTGKKKKPANSLSFLIGYPKNDTPFYFYFSLNSLTVSYGYYHSLAADWYEYLWRKNAISQLFACSLHYAAFESG